jgi:hypothetical protein
MAEKWLKVIKKALHCTLLKHLLLTTYKLQSQIFANALRIRTQLLTTCCVCVPSTS